jgi:hypothetical protein
VVEVKELSFKIENGMMSAKSQNLEETDSLSKVYEGKGAEYYLIENENKTDYEIRSTYSDDSGHYVLIARYRKVP